MVAVAFLSSRIFAGFSVIEYWPRDTALRDNPAVGQMSFFTAAQTVSMRDRTKRRNYSPEAEQFRLEHAVGRSWGLRQRHAGKMRRLHGSAAAAWTTYQDRIDELQSAVPTAHAGGAGLPASAGTGDVAEVVKVESDLVRSVVIASAQVASVPLATGAIELVLVSPRPVLAEPVTAELIRPGVPALEPILSEAVPADPISAGADLTAHVWPDVPGTVAAKPIGAVVDLSAQVGRMGRRPSWRSRSGPWLTCLRRWAGWVGDRCGEAGPGRG
jgi:hypothetical protein